MDDQSPNPELTAPTPRPAGQPGSKWLTGDRLVAVILICTALGFLGTLIGFIPLIAIAMIGPVVAASMA